MQWTIVARHCPCNVHVVTILSALLAQSTRCAVEQTQYFHVIDILAYHLRNSVLA